MPDFYLIIVWLLFALAIVDLIVGVSNDAVNFLNSSIGSQVAPLKVIMIIASAGILIGASFSGGMMEVARKGIFNPEYFVFGDIMIVFAAVMLTDIILLDFFNTVGLPTSTTVSIVFELLGAAVLIASFNVINSNQGLGEVLNYINSSHAGLIIAGIFLSILFAFFSGVIAQFVSRLLFSFEVKKSSTLLRVTWSAVAMTAMTYFLVFKGIKGASFVSDSFIDWTKAHIKTLALAAFGFWALTNFLLQKLKFDPLRLVVLFGTFSLAMAFAGNDLVNFIGVLVAGMESFFNWDDSGADPTAMTMESLQQPVRTNSWLLLGAGIVMIATLWFSKKARSVTETEVNLGRQSEGDERFRPNFLAKVIVRYANAVGVFLNSLLPDRISNWWSDNSPAPNPPNRLKINLHLTWYVRQ